jgi:hypothetical protein
MLALSEAVDKPVITSFGDLPPTKFQIVSDIHIESLQRPLLEAVKPVAPYLIIAGDLGRVENWAGYQQACRILCGAFEKVFLIPGNHEYYAMNAGLKVTVGEANWRLKTLQDGPGTENMVVLIDQCITIDKRSVERSPVTIYGSTFWSRCPLSEEYKMPNLYYDARDANGVGSVVNVTAGQFNDMHDRSVSKMKDMLEHARRTDRELVVVTHYAPTFTGTLAPRHAARGKTDPKNFMYCSDNDALVAHPAVKVWVYGHTGHNGVRGKLVTNQIDRSTGLSNAVLTIR